MAVRVRIDEISFENYRQYGTSKVGFSHGKKHELFVFKARNGTGKTTFLNAITWCLYEIEELLDPTKTPLPLVNSKVLSIAKDGDIIPVSVNLRIIDNSSYISFKRTQQFKVIQNDGKPVSVLGNTSSFVVTITKIADKKNSQTYENVDAEMVVKQYFDREIYDFYFFDGENLRNYFIQGRSERIKESIYNIAQVTLLNNAINRISTMKKEKMRAMGKNSSTLPELLASQERLIEERDQAAQDIKRFKDKIDKATKERDRLDEALREFKPIKSLQDERDQLEESSKLINNEREQYKTDLSKFIREYIIYLKMYPLATKLLKYINSKVEDGKLPPEIDTKLIERLITDMGDTCPVCDQAVTGDAKSHALSHLRELLRRFDVSNATSNYLMQLRPSLIQIVDEAKKYKVLREQFKDKDINIRNRQSAVDDRLETISGILSNYQKNDNDRDLDVSKMEGQRIKLNNDLLAFSKALGGHETVYNSCVESLKDLEPKIQKEAGKENKDIKIKRQVDILQQLESNYILVRDDITTHMREEIQETTERYFRRMSSKKNTFGSVSIDDNYNVEVFSQNGHMMTGSLSATEQMALAYSFTLAIHKASGKNCPLVIDSPLGRVSDKNRENMARALFEVSTEKQIIMLFTPDEFSDDVKRVYGNNVVIRELVLGDDESAIESGVDH